MSVYQWCLNLIWFPVIFAPTGLFTGSAWTCAAAGEASGRAWPSSRSSPWWLSICSSCTTGISKSHYLAPRTSSIIRSPPLPCQGRHHRAQVANQTSYPQTSWTFCEEASCAFFFQRRRSFKNRPFLWSAVQHSYTRCHYNLQVCDGLTCIFAPPIQDFFKCGFMLIIWNARALSLLVAEEAFEQCSSLICPFKLFQCLYLMFWTLKYLKALLYIWLNLV